MTEALMNALRLQPTFEHPWGHEEYVHLTALAVLSYRDPGEIPQGLEVESIADGHMAFLKADYGDLTVILVRGSDDVPDWRANIRADMTPPDIHGHRFHAGFEIVGRRIFPHIHQAVEPGRRLLMGGHSLGGATSGWCLHRILRDLPDTYDVVGRVSWGCPRWANEEVATWMDYQLGSSSVRIVNAGDPVTRIPLSARGFYHEGTPVMLYGDGRPPKSSPGAWEYERGGWHVLSRSFSEGPSIAEVPGISAREVDLVDDMLERTGMATSRLTGNVAGRLFGFLQDLDGANELRQLLDSRSVARWVLSRGARAVDAHSMAEYFQRVRVDMRSLFGRA